ncbi:ArsS family sensor histidine kinase [Hippea maritima]|uniref:ArsS family sensor histidine kinase n=1 Tax=Hippea maritima TaxID=84405 RepID=UPI0011D118BE|nr:ArsS family sensor histidine kinase [Hippea maritima]
MNKSSILFKLSLIFILTFVITTVLFFFVYNSLKKRAYIEFTRKTLILLHTSDFESYAENEGLKVIGDERKIYSTLKGAIVILKKISPMGDVRWALIRKDGNLYLYVVYFGRPFLIKKPDKFENYDFVLALWIMYVIGLLLLYISIFRSIYPLKVLGNKIREFKNGRIDTNFDIRRRDEVGFLASQLKEALENLRKNNKAKQWFLRNIAHEFKTPLTKGMIAAELLEDNSKKEAFLKIFKRLDALVSELLSVEKIASKGPEDKLNCLNLLGVVEDAKSLLFLDDKNIEIVASYDVSVRVEKELFVIAIKNLMDNGIKFSEDGLVRVVIKSDSVLFLNKGNKPKIDESLMFEPFVKETSYKNKNGMGLGLYITRYILDRYGVRVDYSYKSGFNVFKLDISKILC